MFSIVISMCLFAFIGAVTPGPVNIIATSTAVNFGFIRSLPHVLGASVSYALIVFIAGFGLSELLIKMPNLTRYVQITGALFLLYMAYKIASSKQGLDEADTLASPPGFYSGVLVQVLNPKAWLVSLSGVSLFVAGSSAEMLYLIVFTTVSLVICFIGVGTWAGIGHIIRQFLSKKENYVLFNRLMALLLAITVIAMFTQSL